MGWLFHLGPYPFEQESEASHGRSMGRTHRNGDDYRKYQIWNATVTPFARRCPWKLARETATLDQLSGGRLILGVGLGEPGKAEFEYFGESGEPKVRAAKLDEGLDILTGLWRGKPFSYEGEHFHLKKMSFGSRPVQTPRIPIWVGGFWPNKPPFRQAAKWDCVIPLKKRKFVGPRGSQGDPGVCPREQI